MMMSYPWARPAAAAARRIPNAKEAASRGRTTTWSWGRSMWCRSHAAFSSDPTTPTASMPSIRHTCSACRPTPPAAECTRASLPRAAAPSSTRPYHAVRACTTNPAPCSAVQLSGTFLMKLDPTLMCVAKAPKRVTPMTRSPSRSGLDDVAETLAFPMDSTMPQNSSPGTTAWSRGAASYIPRTVKTSAKLSPTYLTLTRTSESLGAGRISSTSFS
mmetsp:Transcript_42773/g.114471  ORF Transcript_42773/g.114471 Transcript_42773/m.114471 type:complete len:216 (-) Transcript_42773:250-897(-)